MESSRIETRPFSSWAETLPQFLDYSNEDECYTRLFRRLTAVMLRQRSEHFRSFRWVDVGPGPGTKTRNLLSTLCSLSRRINLELIEPDSAWLKTLSPKTFKGVAQSKITCALFPCTLGEYLGTNGSWPRPLCDLVTAFHVMYDTVATDSVAQMVDANSGTMFVLTAESADSTIGLWRAEFSRYLNIPCVRSFLPDLEERPALKKRRVRRLRVANKIMRIEMRSIGSTDEPGWLVPFVLGTSKDTFMSIEMHKKTALMNNIRKTLTRGIEDHAHVLIPDDVLIVFPCG